jgi:pimeloyl-ACP methyl ester carboxylesterase
MPDGLLLLHAWPLDARMWEPQRSALPSGLRVAAPNHPGLGGSPRADGVTTMRAAAERTLGAMEEAGIDHAVVCGLSLGGYVAFELWRRARDRVAGLVLANTRAVADSDEAAAGRRALADRLRAEGNILAQEPPPLLSEDAPAEIVERVRGWIADQPGEGIAAAAVGIAERPDSTPDLEAIHVPTLVVTSTGDRMIPAEVSVEMGEKILGARIETLEGVGHLSNLEAPDAFNALLIDHLAASGLG